MNVMSIFGRPDYTPMERIRFFLAVSIGTVIVAVGRSIAFIINLFRFKKNAP